MKKARVTLQIDPRELRVDIYRNGVILVKNKFGLENIRITHMPTATVTECNLGCKRHPDISAWNIDRKKCAMSQLKQKLNEVVK
jgi:hypothetical protein